MNEFEFQLFRKEKDDISNYKIWKACNDYTLANLRTYFENAYSSQGLGEIIYDGQYIEISKAIRRDIFLQSFDTIMQSLDKTGTFEMLITIIKAIFGADAGITFNMTSPGVLEIDIEQHSSDVSNWIAKDGENIITIDGDNLIFQIFINQIYIDEVINLFNQFLKPAGIVYFMNITYV
ncbi:MAG: hypothetical protein LBD46_06550 [Endomicrobium sp.]|jgi:hypothetical protein|nr:hypothetical protein [Endomicrobium sp.]